MTIFASLSRLTRATMQAKNHYYLKSLLYPLSIFIDFHAFRVFLERNILNCFLDREIKYFHWIKF